MDIKHIYTLRRSDETQSRKQIPDHSGFFVYYLLNVSESPGRILPRSLETNQHSAVSIRA